jgi:hypothetical protein
VGAARFFNASAGVATGRFSSPSNNFHTPVGVFDGQSDIGAALVPGSTYDPATKQYTIRSAGYNIWYSRDEFRYIWKKYNGDASLAADARFPDPKGYDDRTVVLIIRQNLDDDSQEAMIGEHGSGMIHLAQRPKRGAMMTDMQYRFGGTMEGLLAKRIGIEKHGDSIAIFVSLKGEPMSQLGPPIHLHLTTPSILAWVSARTCLSTRILLCSQTLSSRTRLVRCSSETALEAKRQP